LHAKCLPRGFEDFAARQAFEVFLVQVGKGLDGLGRPVHEQPNEPFFGLFQLSERWHLPGGDDGLPIDGGFTDFRSNDIFCNARLVRDAIGELIAGRRVRNPRRHPQHRTEEFTPDVAVPQIEARRRPIEQILQIRLRTAQSFTIPRRALLAYESIGIFAAVQHHDVDVKSFRHQ